MNQQSTEQAVKAIWNWQGSTKHSTMEMYDLLIGIKNAVESIEGDDTPFVQKMREITNLWYWKHCQRA